MANEELVRRLKEGGVKEWNTWREENPEVKVDLSGADLSPTNFINVNFMDTYLRYANLSHVNLRDANLRDANLRYADLRYADLSSTNFIDANLSYANLRDANLSGVNLSGANLSKADFSSTNLSNADLSDTNLDTTVFGDTILANVNLSNALGLNKIKHDGPSELGQGTLGLSQGQLPNVFLKGCGLSDWEITASKLHNTNLTPDEIVTLTYEVARLRDEIGIQLRRVFISYSRTDERIADFINKRLDKDGIRAWQDTHDATAGPTEEIVKRAIEQNRVFLLILSESAFESDWVEHEVFIAREVEKRFKRNVICPIALDDSWKTSIWRGKLRHHVEKYNILDFSKWEDPDSFETQYAKLLKGLDVYYLGI